MKNKSGGIVADGILANELEKAEKVEKKYGSKYEHDYGLKVVNPILFRRFRVNIRITDIVFTLIFAMLVIGFAWSILDYTTLQNNVVNYLVTQCDVQGYNVSRCAEFVAGVVKP